MLKRLRSLRVAGAIAVIALVGGTALIVSADEGGPVGGVLGLQSTPTTTAGGTGGGPSGEVEHARPTATPTTGTATTGSPAAGPQAQATPGAHGAAVSEAVHAAQAASTPNAGRGAAVSLAACTAAHDRSTLPAGAQNAPGQAEREPKDCSTLGSQSAPGQQQSQPNPTSAPQGQGGGKPTSPPGLSR